MSVLNGLGKELCGGQGNGNCIVFLDTALRCSSKCDNLYSLEMRVECFRVTSLLYNKCQRLIGVLFEKVRQRALSWKALIFSSTDVKG